MTRNSIVWIFIICLIFFTQCTKNQKVENGIYVNHLLVSYQDSLSRDERSFLNSFELIELIEDSIYYWGNVRFYTDAAPLSSLHIEKRNNESITISFLGDKTKWMRFDKLPDNCTIDVRKYQFHSNDSSDCIAKSVQQIRRKNLFAGYYLDDNLNDVYIKEDGSISGVEEFQSYNVYFPGGTSFPFKGNNLITTNNGIWNCKIVGNEYFFNQYSKVRDKQEMFPLDSLRFRLTKQ